MTSTGTIIIHVIISIIQNISNNVQKSTNVGLGITHPNGNQDITKPAIGTDKIHKVIVTVKQLILLIIFLIIFLINRISNNYIFQFFLLMI